MKPSRTCVHHRVRSRWDGGDYWDLSVTDEGVLDADLQSRTDVEGRTIARFKSATIAWAAKRGFDLLPQDEWARAVCGDLK